MTPAFAEPLAPADVVEHVRAVAVVLERWTEPAPWWSEAACRGQGPDLFFPGPGCQVDPEALATCARCPVAGQCEQAGVGTNGGAWAGRRVWTNKSPLSAIAKRTKPRGYMRGWHAA